jgi:hypothetical protein
MEVGNYEIVNILHYPLLSSRKIVQDCTVKDSYTVLDISSVWTIIVGQMEFHKSFKDIHNGITFTFKIFQ